MICALTNKSPISTYRGAGAPEGTYARERLLDIASYQIGIDPAELRLKNLLPPEALPYSVGLANVEAAVSVQFGRFPCGFAASVGKGQLRGVSQSPIAGPKRGPAAGRRYLRVRATGGYRSVRKR